MVREVNYIYYYCLFLSDGATYLSTIRARRDFLFFGVVSKYKNTMYVKPFVRRRRAIKITMEPGWGKKKNSKKTNLGKYLAPTQAFFPPPSRGYWIERSFFFCRY